VVKSLLPFLLFIYLFIYLFIILFIYCIYFFFVDRYSTLSDVWAIGITMYEVITLHNHFEGKGCEEIKLQLKSGKYPKIEDTKGLYDVEMINIVNGMLSVCFFFCSFVCFYVYFYRHLKIEKN
jgi:serine/threonine protein kinase